MLCGIEIKKDPNLMVGFEGSEDAGVYRLTDSLALVETVDFFTPIVDDPYAFGEIAAANAFSDVYAMGGRPLLAMNIVCFPVGKLDLGVLREILKGGLSKIEEAGAVLVGGHSVEDDELKYGLSVTGIVHPEKVVRNSTAEPGDSLVLTKPIGTGIINTAIKADLADPEDVSRAVEVMKTLNKVASEVMVEVGVSACTDVTGFGLLGHASEMAKASGVRIKLYPDAVPVLSGTYKYANMGLVPAGTSRNKEFYMDFLVFESSLEDIMLDILFDPQTSGGLLISVPSSKLDALSNRLVERGSSAFVVGEVVEGKAGVVIA